MIELSSKYPAACGGVLYSKGKRYFEFDGFKKLFGSEMNKDLLIAFLNALLPQTAGTITDLTFLPNENTGRSEFDRRAIFDLSCKNERGEYFIVEMQRAKQDYFKDRSAFYASFPLQQQAQKGEWNYHLQPVYMVGILDFKFDEDKQSKDVVHHEVKLVNLPKKLLRLQVWR